MKRKRRDLDEDFSLLRGSFTPAQVRKFERMNATPSKRRRRKRQVVDKGVRR